MTQGSYIFIWYVASPTAPVMHVKLLNEMDEVSTVVEGTAVKMITYTDRDTETHDFQG